MHPRVRSIVQVAVAAATPCVVVAAAVVLFLNPIWVAFDQDRSDVTGWTGYSEAQVHQVTGSILSDLVFGPPNFDVAVNGQPVLDASERKHMVDVRNVLLSLGAVAALAAIVLLLAGFGSRGTRWFWAAVRAGAQVLVVGVVVVGLAFTLLFEQAFELFHEIFFSAGTYTFDPRTEKLVQLFPDQFWSETSVAIAAMVLIFGLLVLFGSRQMVRRAERSESETGAAAVPVNEVAR